MSSNTFARDKAIHVLADFITESLRRKRKGDLAEAEIEIRDALLRFFEACHDGARSALHESALVSNQHDNLIARIEELEKDRNSTWLEQLAALICLSDEDVKHVRDGGGIEIVIGPFGASSFCRTQGKNFT